MSILCGETYDPRLDLDLLMNTRKMVGEKKRKIMDKKVWIRVKSIYDSGHKVWRFSHHMLMSIRALLP